MRGLSLVETILSMALLCLAMACALALFSSSGLAIRRGSDQLQADNLAASVLDRERARGFSQLAIEGPKALEPVAVAEGPELTPTLEVRSVDGYPPEVLKEIRVTVSWTLRGQQRQVEHSVLLPGLRR